MDDRIAGSVPVWLTEGFDTADLKDARPPTA
jgi:hypothetical protein